MGLCRSAIQLLSNNNATTATGEFVITRVKSFSGKSSTLRQYKNLLVFCRPGPLRSNNQCHACQRCTSTLHWPHALPL